VKVCHPAGKLQDFISFCKNSRLGAVRAKSSSSSS